MRRRNRIGTLAGLAAAVGAALVVSACGTRGGAAEGPPAATSADTASFLDRAPVRSLTADQNRARSERFMIENVRQPMVQATASGLQYRVERTNPASLARPTAADTVRVHYEGRLIDGQVFDSSFERGEPAEFPLTGVIQAWTEGVPLMKPGEVYTFFVPQELAYGARGAGGGQIPPYSALVFRVELIAFQRPDGTVVAAQ